MFIRLIEYSALDGDPSREFWLRPDKIALLQRRGHGDGPWTEIWLAGFAGSIRVVETPDQIQSMISDADSANS